MSCAFPVQLAHRNLIRVNWLDSIYSFVGDSILNFSSFWRLTALNVDRANTAVNNSQQGGVAECLATNGPRAVHLSIDRVIEDQANRIAESMEAERIELWDEGPLPEGFEKYFRGWKI